MRVAILTSIFGDYEDINDIPKQLKFQKTKHSIDYFCFTDLPDPVIKRHIKFIREYNVSHLKTPRLKAKYFKIQTHKILLLQSYDLYVWVDGRIFITDDFLDTMLLYGNDWVLFQHPFFTSYKDEVHRIQTQKRYQNIINGPNGIISEVNYYEENGFKKNKKLYGGGIFLRKNSLEMNCFFDEWWYMVNRWTKYCDQLSLAYIIFKNNINVRVFGKLHQSSTIHYIKPQHRGK